MEHFNRVIPSRFGDMLVNTNDMYVGKSFVLYGEFSQGEVQLFDAIVSQGDFVIDAGANIGAHTLYFATKKCTVLAFEPQRMVYQLLCANMALNSVRTAYCFNAALGDASGVLPVPELDPDAEVNWGGLSIEGHDQGHIVVVRAVDDYELPGCRLIKVDVEGMEEKVLRGAKQTIREYHPVLYVENDREEKSESLMAYIKELGYIIREHKPPLYNPDNFNGNPENVFGGIVSKNLICVHKTDEKTWDRILEALR